MTILPLILSLPGAFAAEDCTNATDDDADGAADCADLECGAYVTCCDGDLADTDGDGWCDGTDVCVLVAQTDQADAEGDGTGDACDVCPDASDGLGVFSGRHDVGPVGSGASLTFDTADLDGDGDPDLAAATWYSPYTVAWYENLGGGFGPATLLGSPGTGPNAVTALDADADGDDDLVTASYYYGDVRLYVNDGVGGFAGGLVVATLPGGVARMDPIDLDLDGDVDLVAATNTVAVGDLSWLENVGGGGFVVRTIDTFTDRVDEVAPLDVDGDGDDDVVYVRGEVTLYMPKHLVMRENVGGVLGAEQHVAWLSPSWEDGHSIDGGDLDGDGDLDLVVADPGAGVPRVSWLENVGGTFAARTNIAVAEGPITAADLDDDGDVDVLGRYGWWENDGTGAFGEPLEPGATIAADLDGDADLDLVEADWDADVVGWYENRPACSLLDTDADGLTDANELLTFGTDPADDDTDHGSRGDGVEVAFGRDPTWGGDDLPAAEITRVSGAGVGPNVFRVGPMPPGEVVRLIGSPNTGAARIPGCSRPTPTGLGAPMAVVDEDVVGAGGAAFVGIDVPVGFVGTLHFVGVQGESCRASDVYTLTVP